MTAKSEQHLVLDVQGLSKRFSKKPALKSVSFQVPKASLTVLLGAAGAGKTTTLRLIAGLDTPESGEILLSGLNVAGWEPKDRNVAMIFDNLALYPNKNGYANIASPLVIRGEPKEIIGAKVMEMAKTLQITHILERFPKTMSGGERQRIALGRALIRSPSLFLLDEPLSSLDAKLRIELRAELRRMQRDQGYTFLLATPDCHEAMAIADTIVMLRHGAVVQVDTPQNMYDFPVDRKVALFIGAPQINLLACHCEADGASSTICFAGSTLPVPEHFKAVVPEASGFELGIRPENLRLAPAGGGLIRAKLTDIESLGPKSVLTVGNAAASAHLVVDSREALGLAVGMDIGIDLVDPAKLLAFDAETGLRLGPGA
jgi:multiple sugar transport system ATP-binding protein